MYIVHCKKIYRESPKLQYLDCSCDLFLIMEGCDIVNCADDSSAHLLKRNVEEVLNSLENMTSKLFRWFTDNKLKGKTSKCHLLISSGENMHVNIRHLRLKREVVKGY